MASSHTSTASGAAQAQLGPTRISSRAWTIEFGVELVPEDAFGFLDVMTDQMPDKPRAVFVHGDEFNAARGPYPVSKIPSSALVIRQSILDHAVTSLPVAWLDSTRL